MSNTQRCLALARKEGYEAGVVEKWVAFRDKEGNPMKEGVRQDYLGCIDIIACGQGQTVGIQACSGSGHAAHRKKALGEDRLHSWLLDGNRYEIWSWSKRGPRGKAKRWTVRKDEITLEEYEQERLMREAGNEGGPF